MGFPILVRWHLYIESGPRYQLLKYIRKLHIIAYRNVSQWVTSCNGIILPSVISKNCYLPKDKMLSKWVALNNIALQNTPEPFNGMNCTPHHQIRMMSINSRAEIIITISITFDTMQCRYFTVQHHIQKYNYHIQSATIPWWRWSRHYSIGECKKLFSNKFRFLYGYIGKFIPYILW